MIRLPDRVYGLVARVYFVQKGIRRAEADRELERQDRQLREHFARLEAAHDRGQCGGAASGCAYAPCLVVAEWSQR
jgi:hypothetical protein